MNKIQSIYNRLYKSFGPQGWWPLTISGHKTRHHAGEPKNDNHRFEIVVGAILTQNTNWKNVEKSLENLSKNNMLSMDRIRRANQKKLAKLIRSAGYYNQKAERLKLIAGFIFKNKNPTREELLDVKGIGPETADSILLYAFNKPIFVVDAYTKRIFERLGFKERGYDELQELFHKNLNKDYKVFNEYHALLVELGKNYCRKKPNCGGCPITQYCGGN